MTENLDVLLRDLDPSRTLDDADAKRDHFLQTLPLARWRVDEWHEYTTALAIMYRHCENVRWGCVPPLPVDPDADWFSAADLLCRIYGNDGVGIAFGMAKFGEEGGLAGIARAMAAQLIIPRTRDRIEGLVANYFYETPPEAVYEDIRDYIRQHHAFLPAAVTQANPASLYHEFRKLLCQHPHMLRGIGSMLGVLGQ